MLYIVSTPIGNLKDITIRALEVLKEVDLIAAEDTRQTRKLTQHYAINTPLTSYFEHNKFKKGDFLLSLLKQGQKIALVTDAGTPGISDPGYHIINLAIQNNIPITAIPGPTALITALSLSGMPTHKFVFEGFLPPKQVARCKRLKELSNEQRTIIIYESPHRIKQCLQDISQTLNDPTVVCARELTKKFEEIRREKASLLVDHFNNTAPRGEFVLVLNLTRQ